MLSVGLHFGCHAANLVILVWINSGHGLCDSYGLWHEQVYFYKFLIPVCLGQEHLKEAAVILILLCVNL